ncbi:fimbria/pilus outer membrane usher protein [Orbus sturtevantii]|uniref:fimbria/pilus outer membrane usher protein n=1 Tax=Orbus sturtevantii TaxID=3074109 RepID=UPI00370D3619
MKYKLKRVSLCSVIITLLWYTLISSTFASSIDTLPNSKLELYLELVINGFSTNHIAAIDYEQPNFFISPQDLTITGIAPSHWQQLISKKDGKINLNQIKNLTATYQQEKQQLLITVPPAWLPNQTVSLNSQQTYYPAENSNGLLFNYDAYVSNPQNGDSYAAIWTDVRFFSQDGALQSTGSYQQPFSKRAKRYIRYDTSWQSSNQQSMSTIDVGDFITKTLSWSDPVRLGGLQIAKNFSIRPDIITYPLPQLSGENNLPSTVDLLVNGYKVESSSLNSGPFTLTNVPFINGAGEATIITTDALGRQVSTTIPLYVTSRLLKQGLADYSFSSGFIRQKYAIDSFRYNQLAINGNYRYGLTDYLTAESHIEAAKYLQQFGVGSTLRLGVYGVINGSYGQSYYGSKAGKKITLGYQYNHRAFNVALQYSTTDNQFLGLPNLEYGYQIENTNRQITFGLPLGQAGNLVAGYFKIKSQNQSANELVNLSWNRSFNQFGNLFFSISKSNQNHNWTSFLQLMIPLNQGRDTLSITANKDSQNQYSQRVNYNHNQPYNGGFGGNLSYQNNSHQDNYYQGDISWRNQNVELYSGAYGTDDDKTLWANAVGAIIFMDNQLYAANSVQDAFVAVSTNHIANVDIYYENIFAGKTDDDGHLLLTKIPAYYAATYSIDPLSLNENLQVDQFAQHVAVKSQNGYVLKFAVNPITPIYLTLVDEQNKTLPLGSRVVLNGKKTTYIGWDGFVYFDNIEADNQLLIYTPEQNVYQCMFSSDLELNHKNDALHTLICHQEKNE